MQWLIDLIIEAIGIPPVFIDRGDSIVSDWSHATLTVDGAWHDLDLSTIIPANASAVAMILTYLSDAVNRIAMFRTKGNTNEHNIASATTQAAWINSINDLIVAPDNNRKIQYKFTAGGFTFFDLTIKGWWL